MYSRNSKKDRVVFFTEHASKSAMEKATGPNPKMMDAVSIETALGTLVKMLVRIFA